MLPRVLPATRFSYAGVVELVDTLDSKSNGFAAVPVRFRPSVPLSVHQMGLTFTFSSGCRANPLPHYKIRVTGAVGEKDTRKNAHFLSSVVHQISDRCHQQCSNKQNGYPDVVSGLFLFFHRANYLPIDKKGYSINMLYTERLNMLFETDQAKVCSLKHCFRAGFHGKFTVDVTDM